MSKTSSAAKNRYNEKAYDRILFVIPKGEKAEIAAAAHAVGEKSINAYISQAVKKRMEAERALRDSSK